LRALVSSPAIGARRDLDAGARDFAALALFRMTVRSAADREAAMHSPLYSARVKAAVEPGATTDSTFGEDLNDYQALAAAFLASLTSGSAFDRMLDGGMVRVHFKARVATVTVAANGAGVNENMVKPISSMTIAGAGLDPVKATSITVSTNESLRLMGGRAVDFIGGELRRAVSRSTNAVFLPALAAAAGTTVTSVNSPLADLRALLEAVSIGEGARLYWILAPTNCKRLSTMPTDAGGLAFPQMGPLGGSIGGIGVMASDEMAADEGVLVDASQIAAETGSVIIDQARHALLQLDTSPDSPAAAATVLTSLWQRGETAIRAERFFGYEVLRAAAVAKLDGATYGSPDSPV
jgi:hypothetical protein